MNFITPLLFVFYLQVMPPPPTVVGGGDYWAGNTNINSTGNSVNLNWNSAELGSAIQGVNTYKIGGYSGIEQVVTAIEEGWMTNLVYDEWFTLLQWTVTLSGYTGSIHLRACVEARNSNVPNVDSLADQYQCPANAPIPEELRFLTVFSFLGIYYFCSLKKFSKFIRV